MNTVRSASATHPHQHFSHFRMPHSAFVYRCGCGFNLCLSAQKLVQMCRMSVSRVHSRFYELKWYPYRIAIWQELKSPHYTRWNTLCRLNSFVPDGIAKLNTVFFSNETWVHLGGCVNAQNFHKHLP